MNEGINRRLKRKERRPFLWFLASFILPLWYRIFYGLRIRGKENIPSTGSVILASSHVSARDPVFLGCALKRQVFYMAKASLFKNKFVSAIIRYAGAFPVERGTGGGDALQEAYDILEAQRVCGVFIEGTRSKDGELLKPKTGISLLAYKTKSTIVPVSIIAEGGTCPQKFKKKMMINIGKPISFDELGMEDDSGVSMRRASRFIMTKIAELRQEAIELMEEEKK